MCKKNIKKNEFVCSSKKMRDIGTPKTAFLPLNTILLYCSTNTGSKAIAGQH